jgi:hypothetical protein
MKSSPYLEVKGGGLEGVDFGSDHDDKENRIAVGEA